MCLSDGSLGENVESPEGFVVANNSHGTNPCALCSQFSKAYHNESIMNILKSNPQVVYPTVFSEQQELLRKLLHSGLSASPPPAVCAVLPPKDDDDKPKRPLSAYNFFFAKQRQLILDETPIRPEGKPRRSHGKIGFGPLARTIAARWKVISPETRQEYDDMAAKDKARYQKEITEWKRKRELKQQEEELHQTAPMLVRCIAEEDKQSSLPTMLSYSGMYTPDLYQSEPVMKYSAPCMALDLEPMPHSPVSHIADLADRLDNDCVDMLVSMFCR